MFVTRRWMILPNRENAEIPYPVGDAQNRVACLTVYFAYAQTDFRMVSFEELGEGYFQPLFFFLGF